MILNIQHWITRHLVGALIITWSVPGFAAPLHATTWPTAAQVFTAVHGKDERDTGARRLAALDALIELVKEKRPGGKFSGQTFPAPMAEKLAEYNGAHRSLFSEMQAMYSGSDWKSFYKGYLGYSGDKAFKLSVIEQLVPDEAGFMAGIYQMIIEQQSARGNAILTEKRAAFFAEYRHLIGYAILGLAVLLALWSSRMRVYTGRLQRLGEGRKEYRYGVTRLSVVEIGSKMIKGVSMTEIVSSYMDLSKEMTLYVAPLFHTRFIYGVRLADGRLIRMGFGLIGLSLFAKLLVLAPLAAAAGVFDQDPAEVDLIGFAIIATYLLLRSVRAFIHYFSMGGTAPGGAPA